MPCNYLNNNEYTGINRLILLFDEFLDKRYLTVHQIHKLWGKIKKWSKWTRILYWYLEEEDIQWEEQIKKKIFPLIKYYVVFNIEQTTISKQTSIDYKNTSNKYGKAKKILQEFIDKPPIVIGLSPCYSPKKDEISIPNINSFKSIDDYYSTLFHELIHSTGIEKRLWRYNESNIKFWDTVYSREELVAELWSLFICSKVGIIKNTFNNSVWYLQWWLSYLNKNKKELIYASIEAEKAIGYILKDTSH